MSFTPDGRVHYFARPGVEDLTAEDHITSQSPYSFNCERLDTFFFNVVSGDNGNWSTPWIIDDPKLFVIPPQGHSVAELYPKKKPQVQKQQTQQVAKKGSVQQPDSESHSETASKQSSPSRGRGQR